MTGLVGLELMRPKAWLIQQAEEARLSFGIHEQHAPNLLDVYKRVPDVLGFKTEVIDATKNKIAQARVNYRSRTLYMSDRLISALQYNDISVRKIFAHEIGHICLKHRGDNHKYAINIRTRSSRKIEEAEASVFGDHFLAANHLLRRYTSVRDIQTFFLLPFADARRRLSETLESASPASV